MAFTYVAKTRGDIETVTVLCPSGGVSAGSFVKVGGVAGIALNTAAENEALTLVVKGLIVVPKTTAAALPAGTRVSLNLTAAAVTAPGAEDDWYCGWVTTAALQAATEVEIWIDGFLHEQVPGSGT